MSMLHTRRDFLTALLLASPDWRSFNEVKHELET